MEAAKEEGVELTDEQLEAVSGGCSIKSACPRCGGRGDEDGTDDRGTTMYKCPSCGFRFYK